MRVLVFGDSVSYGSGDTQGGWVDRLKRVYGGEKISSGNMNLPTMYNLGVLVDDSAGVLNRFERETQSRYRSDRKVTFVVAIGINDSRMVAEFEHANVETYVRNLAEISSIARSYSSRIMFIGLTPCVESRTNPLPWVDESYTNERIRLFDSALESFCTNSGYEYVELFSELSIAQEQQDIFPDGLHPDGVGHELIADIVKPRLDALLDQ
jgi:lysophospholipase L1-like esterase